MVVSSIRIQAADRTIRPPNCDVVNNKDVDMMLDLYGRGDYDYPNRFIFNCLISCLLAIILISSRPVLAGENRHHAAHVHGVAHLNIAIEGNNIYIEFFSPAANIVGFEHHPRTHEQKNAVKEAVNKLRAGASLFLLSAKSESRLVNSSVNADIDEDADHHSESEHDHAKNENHDKEDHTDKEHSEADEHESHSEFEAEYHFICKKPDRLSQVDVRLFQVFPGIEHIEVQLLNGTTQTAIELTAKKDKISL